MRRPFAALLPCSCCSPAITGAMLNTQGKTNDDARPGWVYVLHDSTSPGEVKVGLTTRTVDKRARELKTGRSSPLVEVWSEHVTNTGLVEDLVFQNLKAHRIGKTEFIAVEPLVAIHALQTEARPFRLNHPRLHEYRFGVLPQLIKQYGPGELISQHALSVDVCKTSGGIFLETCVRVGGTGAATTTMTMTSHHLAATDPDVDYSAWPGDFYENPFSCVLSAKENASIFLGLDPVTQALLTDALDIEAAAAWGRLS